VSAVRAAWDCASIPLVRKCSFTAILWVHQQNFRRWAHTLGKNIRRYRERTGMKSFTPRDFRCTFKTLGGQIKLSKEIRDRIQNHCKHDISYKHYDRYDYFEEKMEGVMIWEASLLALI
jgi:hypothetical protein